MPAGLVTIINLQQYTCDSFMRFDIIVIIALLLSVGYCEKPHSFL